MDSKIEIRSIISTLANDPNIQAHVGNRIFFGQPPHTAEGPYVVVSLVSDIDEGGEHVTHATARVEFRFIGSAKQPFSVLHDAEHAVSVALTSTADFAGFRPWRIARMQNLTMGYSEDGLPVIVRDFSVGYCR